MKQRLAAIHSKLAELNLAGLLVTNEHNIAYLSHFKGEDSYLLFDKRKAFFLTDFRNLSEAKKALKDIEVIQITESIFKTLPQIIKRLKIRRLGFESKSLDFASYLQFKKGLSSNCKLSATFDLIEDMRQIKTPEEIRLIKKAIAITKAALHFAKRIIKPTITENNLIRQIERFIISKGADGFAFAPIVASGKHSSYPHATSTDKNIGNNTAVTIDMGVSLKGYKSDLTRVFFLGKIPQDLRNIYHIVKEAQRKAIAKIKSGISAAQIDNEARTTIAQKGFGRFFQHSTGHGVGLEIHEKPSISKRNERPLVSGMVFTVEPAIYLPERFGVRIEDMVLVKDSGCEVLSGPIN